MAALAALGLGRLKANSLIIIVCDKPPLAKHSQALGEHPELEVQESPNQGTTWENLRTLLSKFREESVVSTSTVQKGYKGVVGGREVTGERKQSSRVWKVFEEPEDPSNRSFFSEIISSISDVKFSHSGRYIMTRDYLTVKVWDLNMENRPIETYQVHDYLRSKLCSLYENDCIFDKFECVWNGSDSVIMTGSYNNFFRMFDRNTKRDVTLEASRENSKPRAILKPRKVCVGGKRRKDEISVDSLDFSKKILHTAWHPSENIIAVAATNNLYIFQDKVN
ncbi:hypothetical protein HPG69_016938 [Diceros bicornis minor]|uniref:Serine/threonine-protein phosphatase 2A 55 kDa regulatory subunit B n=1 Tax=Diceros bicornis minor TaxID=77932 RepID=A0A7J7EC10_DICBM|nr:hypothetical protein HPG69_016938 [Diceros bicornis minor]